MALDPEVKRQLEAQAQRSIALLQGEIDSERSRNNNPTSIAYREKMQGEVQSKLADLLAMADKNNLKPGEVGSFKGAIEVMRDAQWNPTGQQALDEFMASRAQNAESVSQLDDFRAKYETQMFGKVGGTLEEALSSQSGELGQLSNVLRQQQSSVFNQELKPLIDQGLASQGLFDSGARVEQQAKALGGLERGRQETLLSAALGGRDSLRGLERSDILGSQANQQSALSNLFDVQRTGITMAYQRQLEQERAALAMQLQSKRGGPDLLSQISQGMNIAVGAAQLYSGNPMGAMSMAQGANGLSQQSGGSGQMQSFFNPMQGMQQQPQFYQGSMRNGYNQNQYLSRNTYGSSLPYR